MLTIFVLLLKHKSQKEIERCKIAKIFCKDELRGKNLKICIYERGVLVWVQHTHLHVYVCMYVCVYKCIHMCIFTFLKHFCTNNEKEKLSQTKTKPNKYVCMYTDVHMYVCVCHILVNKQMHSNIKYGICKVTEQNHCHRQTTQKLTHSILIFVYCRKTCLVFLVVVVFFLRFVLLCSTQWLFFCI